MYTHFEDLSHDNTSGATELIQRLLALCEGCVLGERHEELREGFALLERSQKSMPSLHAVLQILKSDLLPKLAEGGDCAQALGYLSSVQTILDESGERISSLFVDLFPQPGRILTLSRSATVLASLMRLHEARKLTHLHVLESRPMNEGLRTIRDCAERGVAASLMVDAAFMEALPGAMCVVTGADCVSADGYLLNKIGSHPLALCARAHHVPLYVLCDSLKFSPLLRQGIEIEDSPPGEVLQSAHTESFTVWNRYFEWMPVDLVTGFITERGVFAPDQLTGLAAE